MQATAESILQDLSDNTKSFWQSTDEPVRVVETPSALEVMRAVAAFKPCVFKGLAQEWPAMHWTLDTLQSRCSGEDVNVNFTPNGRADAVVIDPISGDKSFVYPAERRIPFSVFKDMLLEPRVNDAVPYLSEQNDNLRKCFPQLMRDIAPSIGIADEAFGADKLEAVNLWVGDERSVTSVHKDFYENMYAVLRGEKLFHLYPPTDGIFLGERLYTTKRYVYTPSGTKALGERAEAGRVQRSELRLSPALSEGCDAALPWIEADPADPLLERNCPTYKLASPTTCTVVAGDVLYIPALWYHRVTQTRIAIAVNYWYDMQFDHRYVAFELSRKIAGIGLHGQ